MIKVGTLLALSILSLSAYAATTGLNTPAPGVLCDKTICADEHGLSVALTSKYLGKQQGENWQLPDSSIPRLYIPRWPVL